MITSVFSKSKSITFSIVFFIAFLAIVVANVKLLNEPITIPFIVEQTIGLFVCSASILVLNFIVRKNNLTQNNNFEILLFSLFCLTLPQTMLNEKILIANFFILLGLRKLISLKSQLNVKKKLFDAAFWIAMATIFYFWSILFFVLIMTTLLLYSDNKVKHWIIPFAGLSSVFILTISASVILYGNFFGIFNGLPQVSFDFSAYNSPQYLIAMTLLLSFGAWASIFYTKNFKKKAYRPSFKVVLTAVIIAFFIIVIGHKKNGSEFLFMFAPLSIIVSNYIESIEEKWFKELFFLVLMVMPFVLLML